MSKLLLSFAIALLLSAGLLHSAGPAPTTAPAKAAGSDVTRVAFSLPPGYAGETKALENGGWAGGWTSPENVNLIVSLAPRPTAGPLSLERAVKSAVPLMIARPCPGMKVGETPVTADFGGYRFLGQPLTGTNKKGPQAGVAGLVDVGDATLSVIAYGPQKAFETGWPDLTAALGNMKVSKPTPGVVPGQIATTHPIVSSTPIGTTPTTVPAGKAITFGHFIFNPPAGWTVKQDEKKVVLTPPGGKAGNPVAVLTLLPPVPGRGVSLPDWLEAFTTAVHKDLAVRQKREAKTADGPGGEGVISQVVVVQAKNATRVEYRVYAAMSAGEDVQPIMMASPDAIEFQNLLPALKALIETAKPVNPAPTK